MYLVAREILGLDFITPEEVSQARPSIVYTLKQTTALTESQPSEVVLKWCKDNGYAVIPAPPTAMSMLDVREIQATYFYFYQESRGLYSDQKLDREYTTSFGWLAIKKTPVTNSTSKNWNEQSELLSDLEHVPNAAEATWALTTYRAVRDIYLLDNLFVRTSSLGSDRSHIYVGFFDAGGLLVDGCSRNFCSRLLGVAVDRKF